MPDAELRDAAAGGKLHEPAVLAGAGPAHAARRPRAPAGHRVRLPVAAHPRLRHARREERAALSRRSRTCAARCTRSRSGSSPTCSRTTARCSVAPRRRPHVPERGAGQALRHSRRHRPGMAARRRREASSAAAASSAWRRRWPSNRAPRGPARSCAATGSAEVLLGEKLPRPPKDVPQLPETKRTDGLTVRQLVEKHTQRSRVRRLPRADRPLRLRAGRLRRDRPPPRQGPRRPADRRRAPQLQGRRRVRRPRRPARLPADDSARRVPAPILPQAARLRPGPRRAALRRAAARRDAAKLDGNDYRVGTAVETIVAAASSARFEDATMMSPTSRAIDHDDDVHQFSRRTLPPRRRRHDGAAVAGVAAGLGRRAARQQAVQRGAGAAGGPVLRQRLPQQGVVGQGRRQRAWSWARCSRRSHDFREKMLFIRGLYNAEALKGNIHSSQTGNLLSGAPLASGGEIRSGTSFDQLLAQTLRPLDQGAEPGAGLRAVEPVGPQELLDALQLAHLVELADHADAAGTLPGPGLRPPVQGRGAARATRACSTPCSTTPATSAGEISTADQRKLDEYLDSVREVEQRIEQRRQAGRAAGLAADARQAEHPRPADGIPQDIAEHMRLMCDILVLGFRTDTTRIMHAQAEQRPLARCGSRNLRRRLHDPPPAVALRHGRLAEGEPVLRRAGRLHRPQAGRDPGRRAHRCSTTRCSCSARA